MKILNIADAGAGGGAAKKNVPGGAPGTAGGAPALPSVEELQKRLEAANARIADYQKADATRTAEEKLIAKKMAAGLTRDQAIAVIARQKAHDQALADKKAARLPRLLEIIRDAGKNLIEARKNAKLEFPDIDGAEFVEAVTNAKG